jgi:hypothetical protein
VGRYPSWIHGHFKVTDTSIKKKKERKKTHKKSSWWIFLVLRDLCKLCCLSSMSQHTCSTNKIEECGNTALHIRTPTHAFDNFVDSYTFRMFRRCRCGCSCCCWYFSMLNINIVFNIKFLCVCSCISKRAHTYDSTCICVGYVRCVIPVIVLVKNWTCEKFTKATTSYSSLFMWVSVLR